MRRFLTWVGGVTLGVLCLGAAAYFAVRPLMVAGVEKAMFVTQSRARQTPANFGAAAVPVGCPSGDRRLDGFAVDAGPRTAAMLIFHGNSETVRDWARVQAYLARQGLSTYVFDYSGFGASSGTPTVERLNADAAAAYACFRRYFGAARARFVFGHSLGSAVLLNTVAGFSPPPRAVVVHGAFSSVRELLEFLGAPAAWRLLTPDVWNSARAARGLSGLPLLVVAGANDSNVPPDMGRKIAIAAPKGDFRMVWGAGHEDVLTPDAVRTWGPVLSFLNARLKAEAWDGRMPDTPGAEAQPEAE